jgi:hypothetical protein
MRKILIAMTMLALFNSGMVYAGQDAELEVIQKKISSIESNKRQMQDLDRVLNSLKIDTGVNSWNFFGRSGNEKMIQKRSLIIRQISGLNSENQKLSAELLNGRKEFSKKLPSGIRNPDYRTMLDYIDSLEVRDCLGFTYLTTQDIAACTGKPEKKEFLHYRLDIQARELKSIERLISRLKAKKNAYLEADRGIKTDLIDSDIESLGDISLMISKSLDLIIKALQ